VDKTLENTKAGLEATGHYSCNILGFLKKQGVSVVLLNPLYTSQRRKSMSLRKTKTDKVDARTIAAMVMSDVGLKPYSDTLYHNEDLKSLTRYRFDKVSERSKLKASLSRLVNILFPELEGLASTLHSKAIYDVLLEFPSAQKVASANLRHLTCLLPIPPMPTKPTRRVFSPVCIKLAPSFFIFKAAAGRPSAGVIPCCYSITDGVRCQCLTGIKFRCHARDRAAACGLTALRGVRPAGNGRSAHGGPAPENRRNAMQQEKDSVLQT